MPVESGLAGDDTSMPDGLLLIGVIVGWAYALAWLAHRFPLVRRFVRPGGVALVRQGERLERNLRRENITDEELASQLRVVRKDHAKPQARRRREI